MQYDLLIKSGHMIDPSEGIDGPRDIALSRGRIAALDDSIPRTSAREVLNAAGCYVTPGFIDIHTHLYAGVTEWGVDADEVFQHTGVTLAVDAGSAGASTLPGFKKYIVGSWVTPVLCYLHLSRIGLPWKKELAYLPFADVEKCVEAAVQAGNLVVGLKLRASSDAVGGNGIPALDRVRRAGDRLELPVMVHISHSPPTLKEILEHLKSGDIVTHAFTGRANRMTDEGDKVRECVRDARRRGVLFDIGHGVGSFSFRVAEMLLSEGFVPDTISTDLHSGCIDGPVHDLPTTMSKFLLLGMDLHDVIAATTVNPAKAIRREASHGSLKVGRQGDIAVFELVEGAFEFTDSYGEARTGSQQIRPVATLLGGSVVFDSQDRHTARSVT